MERLFHSSFGVQLAVDRVVSEIVRFMKADPKRAYTVIIGTDSEQFATKNADFVTAVVVHRRGNGGRFFWRRIELGKFHTLRDRIIQEVLLSLEVARSVLTELQKRESPANWDFEIHADIGEQGETKTLIQEVVGMIRASNFAVKTKPDSFAATKVADRYV